MVGRVPVQLPKVTVGTEEAAVEGGADVGVVVATAVVDDVVEAAAPRRRAPSCSSSQGAATADWPSRIRMRPTAPHSRGRRRR